MNSSGEWLLDFVARLYRGITTAWKLIGEAHADAAKQGMVLNPAFADFVMETSIAESMLARP